MLEARLQALGGQELGGGQRSVIRVAHQLVPFPRHRPVALHQQVQVLGIEAARRGVELLEQPGGGQGEIALRVGRDGPRRPCRDHRAQWRDPIGTHSGEVPRGDTPAGGGGDGGAGRALVEGGPSSGGDLPQRGGQIGAYQAIAGLGRIPVGVERMGGGLGGQLCPPPLQGTAQLVGSGKAVLGEPSRRREDFGESHPSEAFQQRGPACDAPGNGDRQRMVERNRDMPFVPQLSGVGARAGPAGGVERRGGLVSGAVHQREQVAADTAGLRSDHPQHRVGRHRPVHRGASGGHDLHRRLGGQAVGGDGGIAVTLGAGGRNEGGEAHSELR